ncbi:hypothetical protein CFB3_06250 [Clostridium folliculivorans]|uniref:Uncharacterized protein n=1 Tax=Clostridium folliculivorans TaxID=2886038 RepID=A0A9W5Y2N2_9CLOT|nr:hypothetical protein CFOLD11_23220 [Clostridium folliculivorans]GKU28519.1 hypothetical protein CFB3_06250 [Clostridium folliculivorans]
MITFIFIALSFIIFNSLAILMPKKLNNLEILDISIFTLLLQISVDLILDIKFNLYGYFNEGVDLISFITFIFRSMLSYSYIYTCYVFIINP